MAAAAGLAWSRQPASSQPADITAPTYPERPIRPLPKRSLRARLSDDQAKAIVYPPVPPSSSPVFGSSPQSQQDRTFASSAGYADEEYHPPPAHPDFGHVDNSEVCHCGDHSHSEVDSEEDDAHYSHQYSWHDRDGRVTSSRAVRAKTGPDSSTSSADGYESFENTNNKKKRKIPISGSMMPAGIGMSSQSVDMPLLDDRGGKLYPGHSSSGVGLSGPGRGRVGRAPSGRPISDHRKPLSTTMNALNAYPPAVNSIAPSSSSNQGGIISTAIANAGTDKRSNAGSGLKGQENVGLLERQQQQQQQGSGVGTGTQANDFTFECKSDSSTKMGQSRANPMAAVGRGQAPPGNQGYTSQYPPVSADPNLPPPPPPQQHQSQGQKPAAAPKKKPRRPGRALERQARRRKREQATQNYYNPPRPEDEWICEFCEYELIFGMPPTALVRQYEIKDRRERKRQAEQRRLLDKAKAKGRKNRKNKNAAKNAAAAAAARGGGQNFDHHYDNASPQEYDSQGDEFFDDGYDDHAPVSSPHPDDYPPDEFPTPQPGSAAQYGPPPPPGVPASGPGRRGT